MFSLGRWTMEINWVKSNQLVLKPHCDCKFAGASMNLLSLHTDHSTFQNSQLHLISAHDEDHVLAMWHSEILPEVKANDDIFQHPGWLFYDSVKVYHRKKLKEKVTW